jgi:hypothetical protein
MNKEKINLDIRIMLAELEIPFNEFEEWEAQQHNTEGNKTKGVIQERITD